MEKFRVGIIGATGMVGQRFVLLTANHPWFTPVVLAASAHSAGKTYAQAIEGKWHMAEPIPESVKSMIVMDAEADAEEIARQVDFVFCAVNMKKDEIKALEEKYGDQIFVGKVNVAYEQGLVEEYKVMSAPTLIFLKEGEQIQRLTGAKKAAELEEIIDQNL